MSFVFKKTPRVRMVNKKRIPKSKKAVLDRLESLLEDLKEPVEFLTRFWKDQQNAITYKELKELVLHDEIGVEILALWQQDYSNLVVTKLKPTWKDAMSAGAANNNLLKDLDFSFNLQHPYVEKQIESMGAKFITNVTNIQKEAINILLDKGVKERFSIDELARYIRSTIGLDQKQTAANLKYYENINSQLKKDHPKMKAETIRRKAREASAKYAERQHLQRAYTIAQTETAFAYNKGADEGIRQAQEENLLGKVKKVWCTSGDDSVCDICRGLDGTEVEMDEEFNFKGKLLYAGQKRTPPAHPRCACAIQYVEVSPPVFDSEKVVTMIW